MSEEPILSVNFYDEVMSASIINQANGEILMRLLCELVAEKKGFDPLIFYAETLEERNKKVVKLYEDMQKYVS